MPTIQIKGMSCQHCVGSVTKALSNLDGVSDVKVDLETGEAHYQEEKPTPPELIRQAIMQIGFEVL